MKPAARIGRPPAGARAGECVRDYPQVSVRVPPEIKVRLEALSLVRATPQWRVINDAILCYFRDLSRSERRQVECVIRDKPAADGQ